MEEKLVVIIKILGIAFDEIVIDIELENIVINSLEIDECDNIILHMFNSEVDIEIPFGDISDSDKNRIYKILSMLLYN